MNTRKLPKNIKLTQGYNNLNMSTVEYIVAHLLIFELIDYQCLIDIDNKTITYSIIGEKYKIIQRWTNIKKYELALLINGQETKVVDSHYKINQLFNIIISEESSKKIIINKDCTNCYFLNKRKDCENMLNKGEAPYHINFNGCMLWKQK